MEGYCRGCLVKYDQLTDLIQYTEKNRRLYVYSTGIQVKRNDAFPFQLCKDCYVKMKVACAFKKMCRTSDRSIKNYQALKESDDEVDFCSYIKNNDSLAFRFPLTSSSSTPAFHRFKDDDNESTCASIRNFMTDILLAQEIPDTEAQIIQQVIEDEADVLDDSLDSHWLQDDASINTDFRLDLSFSPFSTPRHIFNDHCYTPQKINEDSQSETIVPENTKLLDSPTKKVLTEVEKVLTENNLEVEPSSNHEPGLPNFYVENVSEVINEVEESVNRLDRSRCVIDRNLDRALRNVDKDDICLDELLATPPGGSAISTPTIHNILFGDKDDSQQLGQCIEKYEDIGDSEIDIYSDFYKDEPLVTDDDEDEKQPTVEDKQENLADQYDLTDFSCKLCNNKMFKNVRALNIHFFRTHKVSIKSKIKKKTVKKPVMCQFCGKNVFDRPNLQRHIKAIHMRLNVVPKCDRCGQTFAYESQLKMHMKTHIGVTTEPPKKEHTCMICGLSYCTKYSLQNHIKKTHEKAVTVSCDHCGKGFARKADIVTHLRVHNGDRPYSCLYCDKKFARRDTLSRHIKCHLDENRVKCCYCDKKFKNSHSLKKHIEISETCLKFRLERKLKEDDKDPAVKKKNSKKTRFFVIRPKPIESLRNPPSDQMNVETIDDPVAQIEVPTEVTSEIVFQLPEVTSEIVFQSPEVTSEIVFQTPEALNLNANYEERATFSESTNVTIHDGITFVKENLTPALLSLPLLI